MVSRQFMMIFLKLRGDIWERDTVPLAIASKTVRIIPESSGLYWDRWGLGRFGSNQSVMHDGKHVPMIADPSLKGAAWLWFIAEAKFRSF